MSLKNYIFTSSSVNKATSALHGHDDTTTSTIEEETPETIEERRKQLQRMSSIIEEIVDHPSQHTSTNWVKKAWKYVSVEPVMLCWLLPSCLLYIAVENLALEKSCRVNFGYDDIICDNMIDKSINNINCVDVRHQDSYNNDTGPGSKIEKLHTDTLNATSINTTLAVIIDTQNNNQINISETINQLKIDVCHAEIDSQILDSALNVYTSPFDPVFGIIMILFAGGWSDKKGTRKPCMLLPLIGELLSLFVLLTASIFMKQLPLEYNSIGSKLFPAIFGGSNLMLMGVYSYLTEVTPPKDRTFRFGIFAVVLPLIPIISIPFSGILFKKLRYIKLIMLCIPINIIGILYIIFILKEVKPKEKRKKNVANKTGVDNLTFDMDGLERKRRSSRIQQMMPNINTTELKTKVQKNCLVEFFNPVVAVNCIRVILKKREHNGRRVIALLLLMYFLSIGPAFGEEPNEYNFTRITFNWDGLKYSPFATYGNAVGLIGTAIMVGGLSKICYLSDPVLGFIGSFTSSISRILYALATTTTMMYVARTFDMFIGIRALTIKSTISTFVETAELGRIFSLIGIIEALGKFVFVSLYSLIYKNTLTFFPSAFYLCSFICLVLTALLFIILYVVIRRKKRREAEKNTEQEQNKDATDPPLTTINLNGNENATVPTESENTHI